MDNWVEELKLGFKSMEECEKWYEAILDAIKAVPKEPLVEAKASEVSIAC